MRILIYGTGAVGSYLGAHLALAQHDVTLLGRKWLTDTVRDNGLRLQSASGSHVTINNTKVITEVTDVKDYDFIIFSMKSYDTVTAIHEIIQVITPPVENGFLAKIPPPPPIVCFQNGVGNEQSLSSAFGAQHIIAATLTTPVSMPEPGLIVEEKSRGIALSTQQTASKMIIDTFKQTSLVVETVNNDASLKWSKLLTNMVGNSISAILDMSPAEVYRTPQLYSIERKSITEALSVLRLAEIDLVDLPGIPVKLLATAFERLPTFLSRPLLASRIAKGRGDKLPSLRLALRNQNKATEVEWINGAVVKLADDMDRYAPVNHVLALTLADIAAGRIPWEVYRHNPELLKTAVRSAVGERLQ